MGCPLNVLSKLMTIQKYRFGIAKHVHSQARCPDFSNQKSFDMNVKCENLYHK